MTDICTIIKNRALAIYDITNGRDRFDAVDTFDEMTLLPLEAAGVISDWLRYTLYNHLSESVFNPQRLSKEELAEIIEAELDKERAPYAFKRTFAE